MTELLLNIRLGLHSSLLYIPDMLAVTVQLAQTRA
jgi:hypothetical protein